MDLKRLMILAFGIAASIFLAFGVENSQAMQCDNLTVTSSAGYTIPNYLFMHQFNSSAAIIAGNMTANCSDIHFYQNTTSVQWNIENCGSFTLPTRVFGVGQLVNGTNTIDVCWNMTQNTIARSTAIMVNKVLNITAQPPGAAAYYGGGLGMAISPIDGDTKIYAVEGEDSVAARQGYGYVINLTDSTKINTSTQTVTDVAQMASAMANNSIYGFGGDLAASKTNKIVRFNFSDEKIYDMGATLSSSIRSSCSDYLSSSNKILIFGGDSGTVTNVINTYWVNNDTRVGYGSTLDASMSGPGCACFSDLNACFTAGGYTTGHVSDIYVIYDNNQTVDNTGADLSFTDTTLYCENWEQVGNELMYCMGGYNSAWAIQGTIWEINVTSGVVVSTLNQSMYDARAHHRMITFDRSIYIAAGISGETTLERFDMRLSATKYADYYGEAGGGGTQPIPNITAPVNATTQTTKYLFINASDIGGSTLSSCTLQWNATSNYSMTTGGKYCSVNMTEIPAVNLTAVYRVFMTNASGTNVTPDWYTTFQFMAPDTTPPTINWNVPVNQSFTNNVTQIDWDVSVNEVPNVCLLAINSSANITMTYGSGHCYYNSSSLTNATTYCAKVWVNDSSGNLNVSYMQCATINLTQTTALLQPIWTSPPANASTVTTKYQVLTWNDTNPISSGKLQWCNSTCVNYTASCSGTGCTLNLSQTTSLAYVIARGYLTNSSGTSICYQPTANVSTSCGGLDTGTYKSDIGSWTNFGNVYDGDADTYATAPAGSIGQAYINFTKPPTATGANISYTYNATKISVNITVPSDCWNAFTNNMSLYIFSDMGGGGNRSGLDCMNNSATAPYNILVASPAMNGMERIYDLSIWWNFAASSQENVTSDLYLNFSIASSGEGTTYTCTSCSDCTSKVNAASAGDTIQMTANITDTRSQDCVDIYHKTNITFTCNNNWLIDSSPGTWNAMRITNSTYITVKDCYIWKWSQGIQVVAIQVLTPTFDYSYLSNGVPKFIMLDNIKILGTTVCGITTSGMYNSTFNNLQFWGNTGDVDIDLWNSSSNIIRNNSFSVGNVLDTFFIHTWARYTTATQSGSGNNTFIDLDLMRMNNANVYALAGQKMVFSNRSNDFLFYDSNLTQGGDDITFNTTNGDTYAGPGSFNITKTLGTNIVGGPYLGGNFWQNYSAGCSDEDGDGICASYFQYTNDAYLGGVSVFDWLPLALGIRNQNRSWMTANGTSGAATYIVLNSSINTTDIIPDCILTVDGTNTTGVTNGTQFCYKNVTGLSAGWHTFQMWFHMTNEGYKPTTETLYYQVTGGGDTTPPTIDWNVPTNQSFTANTSSIDWDVSVNEVPNVCLLAINSSANITMTYGSGHCYYNSSSLTNATTYCAKVWANDSTGNMNVSSVQCATINLTQTSTSNITITITSPTNTTYAALPIWLNFTITSNQTISSAWYILNNGTSISLGNNSATYCYQEGISTSCGEPSTGTYTCSGTWNPTYPCSNGYDGDQTTAASMGTTTDELVINRSKPAGLNNIVWMVRIDAIPNTAYTVKNLTIPDICRDAFLENYSLRYRVDHATWIHTLDCLAVAGWTVLDTDSYKALYEESVWLNMSGFGNTTLTPTLGANNVTVYANDTVGYLGYSTVHFTYDYTQLPSILSVSFSPDSAIVGDNLSVVAVGNNTITYWFRFGYPNGTNITSWTSQNYFDVDASYENETIRVYVFGQNNIGNGTVNAADLSVTRLNITSPADGQQLFGSYQMFSFNITTQVSQNCTETINSTAYELGLIPSGTQNHTRYVWYGNNTYNVTCYSKQNETRVYYKVVNFSNAFANWSVSIYKENDWNTPLNITDANLSVFMNCQGGDQYVYNFMGTTLPNILPSCDVQSITVKVDYASDSYTRERSIPDCTQCEVRMYMVDALVYTILQIPIYMSDYNYFSSRVELYKLSAGNHYTIAQGYFDVEHKYVVYLMKDNTYFIRIDRGPTTEIREIGYLYAATATAQYLSLSNIQLQPSIQMISDNLQMAAAFDNESAPTSTLRIQYRDFINQTISLRVRIFSDINSTAWFDNTYYATDNLSITLNGINTSLRGSVHFEVHHRVLGNSPIDFIVSVGRGLGIDFGLDPTMAWVYAAIGYVIMLFTAFIIVPEIRLVGYLILLAELGIFSYFSWFMVYNPGAIALFIAFMIVGLLYDIKFKGVQ
jgi:hypothetical protein